MTPERVLPGGYIGVVVLCFNICSEMASFFWRLSGNWAVKGSGTFLVYLCRILASSSKGVLNRTSLILSTYTAMQGKVVIHFHDLYELYSGILFSLPT